MVVQICYSKYICKYFLKKNLKKEKWWILSSIKIINVKNVIIIMSWVGGEEEIWCPLVTSWTLRWSLLRETLGEQAIFLGSYLNCVLHTATISNFKSKSVQIKEGQWILWRMQVKYEFLRSSLDTVPAWCSGSHIFKSCKGLKIFLLTD